VSHPPKGSKPPEKHLDDEDAIHVSHPEGLAEALEDSEALAKKGKASLDAAAKSLPPKARVVPLREEEEADTSGAYESQEDLAEATGVFATSVDIITNALLVILGKFDESCTKQDRSNTRMAWILLIMVSVAGAMGWAVWRIEGMVHQQAEARVASLEAARKQSEAAAEMRKLTEALKKTEEKVDEVKKEQEKQPDIAFEPDGKGGAKMVVTPKCKGDAKDCERKAPPSKKPKAGGKKPPVPPTAKVEIPIPGATSPKQDQAPAAPPDY
jgi:hypothetical protein